MCLESVASWAGNYGPYLLTQLLQHLQVELEEETEGQGLAELHFPTVGRRQQRHLVSEQPACLLEQLLIPGPWTPNTCT